tara:strand:+ start:3631 stop:3978 length:348 start_codon:yes stop_codon:yes gene_type:complete
MALSTDGTGKNYTDFKRLGHPGKFRGVVECGQDTTTNFTGSNYGGSAVFIKNTAGRASGTTITFSDGSSITANILFAGGDIGAPGLVEASVSKVVVADTSNAEVYVLMRNMNFPG